jgi:hypothetical protein
MKTYLFVSGTIFGLFAAMHFFIAYEHWRKFGAELWSGLGPALIGICAGALAVWAFRLTRSASGASSQSR